MATYTSHHTHVPQTTRHVIRVCVKYDGYDKHTHLLIVCACVRVRVRVRVSVRARAALQTRATTTRATALCWH
jgi:hypothetical protein